MKKIFLLLILIPVLAYAETAVIGTQWKQIDSTIYPADDVTAIDISGMSNYTGFPGGAAGGGGIAVQYAYKNISSYFTTTSVYVPSFDVRPTLSTGSKFVSIPMTGLTVGNNLNINFASEIHCSGAGSEISVFANISGVEVVAARGETCENAAGYGEPVLIDTNYTITDTDHTVEIRLATTGGTIQVNGSAGRHYGGAASAPLTVWEISQ